MLPRTLLAEAARRSPPELRNNVNRLVRVALEEFVARRAQAEFDEAMAQMAADPGLRAASAAISSDFAEAEDDGLP